MYMLNIGVCSCIHDISVLPHDLFDIEHVCIRTNKKQILDVIQGVFDSSRVVIIQMTKVESPTFKLGPVIGIGRSCGKIRKRDIGDEIIQDLTTKATGCTSYQVSHCQ